MMLTQYIYLPKNRQEQVPKLTEWLATKGPYLRLAVWHTCSEGPVEIRPLIMGMPTEDWVCPNCGVTQILRENLMYDFVLETHSGKTEVNNAVCE